MTTRLVFQNIFRFIILMLVQVLIINNVSLSGFVVPYIYLLFLFMLPTQTGRIPMLLIAFATGLTMDLFSNLLGFHTFACTAVAFFRILFADRILVRNDHVDINVPNIYTVSVRQFIFYIAILLFLFYLIFFSLEMFDTHGAGRILLSTICSTLFTGGIMLLIQVLFVHKKK